MTRAREPAVVAGWFPVVVNHIAPSLTLAGLAVLGLLAGRSGFASDHQDGPQLEDGVEESADILDFYLFPAPGSDGRRLVMAMTFDHRASGSARPSDALEYRFRLRPAAITGTGGANTWVAAGDDEFTVSCVYDGEVDRVGCTAYPSERAPEDGACEEPCFAADAAFGAEPTGDPAAPVRVFSARVPDPFFEDFLLVRTPRLRDSDILVGGLNTFKFLNAMTLVVEVDVARVLGDGGPLFAGVAETVMTREVGTDG
jgi:hypothetical protein